MKNCPYCGTALPDESSFCLYCMRELDEKTPLAPPRARRKARRAAWIASALIAFVALASIFLVLTQKKELVPDPNDPRTKVYADVNLFRLNGEGTSDAWSPENLIFLSENSEWRIYSCPAAFQNCVPKVYFKKDGTDVIVALNDLILDSSRAWRFDEQSGLVSIMESIGDYLYREQSVNMRQACQLREDLNEAFRDCPSKRYSLLERLGAGEDPFIHTGSIRSNEYLTDTWEEIGENNRYFYFQRVRLVSEEEARLDAIFYFTFGSEDLP